jgi:O-acetyl-ADP-ribose deacetylase
MSRERIEVVQADITRLEVDVIVNAANSSLLGGGGVDGAIHRAAGPGLLEECRAVGGCKTGHAVMTRGHRLPARHIVHTVGPVWNGGQRGEADLLASCYQRSLELAARAGARTIAFPMISTGRFRFPLDQAARIAVATILEHIDAHELPELIILCTFDDAATAAAHAALDRLLPESRPDPATNVEVQCPYCGEPTEITPDERGGSSVEDCIVCCRPIDVIADVDDGGAISIQVRRQDA